MEHFQKSVVSVEIVTSVTATHNLVMCRYGSAGIMRYYFLSVHVTPILNVRYVTVRLFYVHPEKMQPRNPSHLKITELQPQCSGF